MCLSSGILIVGSGEGPERSGPSSLQGLERRVLVVLDFVAHVQGFEVLVRVSVRSEGAVLQEVALLGFVLLVGLDAHARDYLEVVEFPNSLLDELLVLALAQVLVLENVVEVGSDQAKHLVERSAIGDVLFPGLLVLAEREPSLERGALVLVVLS